MTADKHKELFEFLSILCKMSISRQKEIYYITEGAKLMKKKYEKVKTIEI